MENQTVISVKNIGKRYNIAHQQGGYISLRDVLANVLKKPFTFLKQKTKKIMGIAKNEEFWALRNVSFEVKRGEVIGVIGRNGAGKSTLLKVLSQITPPTEGEIRINGRIGSLLEVGTGFHPELSGRENIFLNGAILGMTRKEIAKKFDAIVAFAGIEKFLDTPVKRYSSGMYVRLAFSVAAHMDPDILVIDEVLAVGDAEFQKKCLGKMDEITKKDGRTIIFVSHNMQAIQQLCGKCVLLENGQVKMIGETEKIVSEYINSKIYTAGGEYKWSNNDGPGDNTAKLHSIKLCAKNGQAKNIFDTDEPIIMEAEYSIKEKVKDFSIGFSVLGINGTYVFYSADSDPVQYQKQIRLPGKYVSRCIIPRFFLNNGSFIATISGGIYGERLIFSNLPDLKFNVVRTICPGSVYGEQRKGVLNPELEWDIITK